MNVDIRPLASSGHPVPETLLGFNLEMAGLTQQGLLSDRLDNPKFLGPANPVTQVAPGWQPRTIHQPGTRFELTSGIGLGGSEAQLIQTNR